MFCQNVALTQQILGIGGWMFSGFQSRYMLGADKEYKGLGFTCVESKEDWGEAVSKAPIGLDGLFEAFSPPYYSNMGEAVEAFNDMKWSNWEEKFMPYKDPTGVLKDTPRPGGTLGKSALPSCIFILDSLKSSIIFSIFFSFESPSIPFKSEGN